MKLQVLLNAGFLIAAKGIGFFFPIIALPVLTRSLGPSAYGELQYILSFVTLFYLFTEFGTSISATRAIALARDSKSETAEIISRVISLRLFLCLISFSALCFIMFLQGQSLSKFGMVSLAFLIPLGEALNPSWYYMGRENTKPLAFFTLSARAVTLPLILLVVRTPADLGMAVFCMALPWVIGGVAGLVYLHWLERPHRLSLSFRWLKEDVVAGISASLTNLLANTMQPVAIVILGLFATKAAVGSLGVAMTLIMASKQALLPIAQAAYANSGYSEKTDPEGARKSKVQTLCFVTVVGCCCSFALFFGSPYVVPVFFGLKYSGVIELVRMLAVLPMVFIVWQTLALEFLFSANLGRRVSSAMILGNVVCVILCFALARAGHERGVALAMLVGECLAASIIGLVSVNVVREGRKLARSPSSGNSEMLFGENRK